MKIALIAAKGRVGAAIVKEAKSRGLDVTEINQDVYTLRTSDLTTSTAWSESRIERKSQKKCLPLLTSTFVCGIMLKL